MRGMKEDEYLQSVLQRNLSQLIQPMGGERARPLSRLRAGGSSSSRRAAGRAIRSTAGLDGWSAMTLQLELVFSRVDIEPGDCMKSTL